MNLDYTNRQPDREKMRQILQLFKPLAVGDLDSGNGFFYFLADGNHESDPTCPMCVGLTIAFNFDLERLEYTDGSSKLAYTEGEDFLCQATDLDNTELATLLHRHGAPAEPFHEDWLKRPYDVLKPAFEFLLNEQLTI